MPELQLMLYDKDAELNELSVDQKRVAATISQLKYGLVSLYWKNVASSFYH